MQFRHLAAMAAVIASCGAAAAHAQPAEANYYQLNLGSGLGGNVHLNASVAGLGSESVDVGVKPGFFGSLAVGHSFGNGLAIEGEGYYAKNDGDTESISSSAKSYGALANLMYAIRPVGPVVPYVGAGVGVGHTEVNVLGGSDGATGVVWQLRAGLSGDVTPTLKWDVGYRYFSEPRYDKSGTVDGFAGHLEIEPRIHVLTVGLRQRF